MRSVGAYRLAGSRREPTTVALIPTPIDPEYHGGGPCWRCGHRSGYHGATWCVFPAGSKFKRDCDCPGYTPVGPVGKGSTQVGDERV